MNKLLKIIKGIIIATGMVGTAHAAAPLTGFYAGMDSGFAFNNIQLKSQQLGFTNPSETCNINSDFVTFFPGMQMGYLHQFSSSVILGSEIDFTLNANQKETLNCISEFNSEVYDRFIFKNQLQTSIKARLGRVVNWRENIFLPYLTSGISIANLTLTYKNEGGDNYSVNNSEAGWLIGTGIEWAFKQHWSVRGEYSYVDYGYLKLKIPSIYGLIDPNGYAHLNQNTNKFMLTINYWV